LQDIAAMFQMNLAIQLSWPFSMLFSNDKFLLNNPMIDQMMMIQTDDWSTLYYT